METRREFTLPGHGLKCAACGAVLGAVDRTKPSAGLIMRERDCQECGAVNETAERVITSRTRRPYGGE